MQDRHSPCQKWCGRGQGWTASTCWLGPRAVGLKLYLRHVGPSAGQLAQLSPGEKWGLLGVPCQHVRQSWAEQALRLWVAQRIVSRGCVYHEGGHQHLHRGHDIMFWDRLCNAVGQE